MRRLTNFSHGWLMVAEGRNSTQHVRNWCCIHRHISEFQCVLNIIGFCTRAPCSIFVNVASEAVICQILSNTMSTIVCLHQLEMNITAQTYPTISFSAEFPSGAAKPRAWTNLNRFGARECPQPQGQQRIQCLEQIWSNANSTTIPFKKRFKKRFRANSFATHATQRRLRWSPQSMLLISDDKTIRAKLPKYWTDTLWQTYKKNMEHGPFIVDLPMKHTEFPQQTLSLPEFTTHPTSCTTKTRWILGVPCSSLDTVPSPSCPVLATWLLLLDNPRFRGR